MFQENLETAAYQRYIWPNLFPDSLYTCCLISGNHLGTSSPPMTFNILFSRGSGCITFEAVVCLLGSQKLSTFLSMFVIFPLFFPSLLVFDCTAACRSESWWGLSLQFSGNIEMISNTTVNESFKTWGPRGSCQLKLKLLRSTCHYTYMLWN